MLPRSSLLIIYKSFLRHYLDYGDAVYDQPNRSSLSDEIKSLQYNTAFPLDTGDKMNVHETSKDFLAVF